jgi:hypothetical protein
MKTKHAAWALAALVLAAPAFAQVAVQSSTGTTVSSGTGLVVTPGVPSATVVAPGTTVVAPVPTVAVVSTPWMSGAVVAQAGTSESVNGNSKTLVTRYWVNVPPNVTADADFQRWQRLR